MQVATVWESMHALEDYPKVRESLVAMLQKIKKIGHAFIDTQHCATYFSWNDKIYNT
jgi:hypothetical protein